MEPNNLNNQEEKNVPVIGVPNNQSQIAGAIVIAGLIIAGAILLRGNTGGTPSSPKVNPPAKVTSADRVLGEDSAKVTVILYEDFQCPFCGAVTGIDQNSPIIKSLQQRDPTWVSFTPEIINNYVNAGTVKIVYRDFAFLGSESIRSAEAARCAGDQGKFWEYHDYLYGHQIGENEGHFSDTNLKSFAKIVGLDTGTFNTCLDTSKHAQAVADSKAEAAKAGVTGTPKGFILKNGKVVATIEGAESYTTVKPKIDAALK